MTQPMVVVLRVIEILVWVRLGQTTMQHAWGDTIALFIFGCLIIGLHGWWARVGVTGR